MTEIRFTRTAAGQETWLEKLLATDGGAVALMLRLTLALVIFPHGAQKMLGWFGGFGFTGTMTFFTDTMGLPYGLGLLVILIEFFAPLALVAGLFSRLAAFAIGCVMVGAVLTSHLSHGFFMNWLGNQQGEGFEFHLLVLGIAAALIVMGSGAFSVDRTFATAYHVHSPQQRATV